MSEPFKNLFNPLIIQTLGEHLHRHYSDFALRDFVRDACRGLACLELKQRSAQITAALEKYLPKEFLKARNILLAALHPDEEADLQFLTMDEHGVRGWAVMPMADYVARRGLLHFDESMQALAEMTKRFSAEFAVRTFINTDLNTALKHIRGWATSNNYHVRRLASEGARPRLPWGQHIPELIKNPQPMLPILKLLRDDPSDYVRRSVANHLNDIAKNHPPLLLQVVRDWQTDAGPQRQRLLRHACRTLVKKGDADILQALGYTSGKIVQQKVVLEKFHISSRNPTIGEHMSLQLHLRSTHTQPQTLVVDYIVYWRRANGTWSPKVFKWKNIQLLPGQTIELSKKHSFKLITTRTYYPGAHKIAVQLNGCLIETLEFELVG